MDPERPASADRQSGRLISKHERWDEALRPIQAPQAKDRRRSVRAHADERERYAEGSRQDQFTQRQKG